MIDGTEWGFCCRGEGIAIPKIVSAAATIQHARRVRSMYMNKRTFEGVRMIKVTLIIEADSILRGISQCYGVFVWAVKMDG